MLIQVRFHRFGKRIHGLPGYARICTSIKIRFRKNISKKNKETGCIFAKRIRICLFLSMNIDIFENSVEIRNDE
jgi:hypothetical protein